MIYYYICDSCGHIEERSFNPDQDFVWCPSPNHHNAPVAMRIVVPEDNEYKGLYAIDRKVSSETKVTLKNNEDAQGCVNAFIYIFVALFLTLMTGIIVLLTAWILVSLWQLLF